MTIYDPSIFHYSHESLQDEDYVIATYYFKREALDHLNLVGFMALESSTGGWMDFPGETSEIRGKLAAKIVGYYPIPVESERESEKAAIVQMAYPTKGTAGWNANIPMLLTAVAGNILEMPGEIKLIDIILPESFVKQFKGPRFGVKGIRELLDAPGRPLVNMMIKPKVGLLPDSVEDMAYQAGLGGVDHIKDDEMMAEVFNSTFEDRIQAVMKGLKRAEDQTGNKALYTVNVSGTGQDLMDRAEKAVELGANAIMVNFSQGFESLRMLAENPNVNVPILFHPAGSSANNSISRMVLAKLARLCGADFYLTSSPWAKWADSEELESIVRSAQLLFSKFYEHEETFIVQSATAGKVPTIIEDFGNHVVLGGGGAIHGHPDGIAGGVKAIHQAINATMTGVSLKDYAKNHIELANALRISPTFYRQTEKRY